MRRDFQEYLENLHTLYPNIENWASDIEKTTLSFAEKGDIFGFKSLFDVYNTLSEKLIEKIIDTAVKKNQISLLQYLSTLLPISWNRVATIARDEGHLELAIYADGVKDFDPQSNTKDFDPFPKNFGPVGIPMEDAGDWIIDWRTDTYDEEFAI